MKAPHSPGEVPDWQLVLWREPAGELVRVLEWAGPAEANKLLRQIAEKVSEAAIGELQQYAALFPLWPRYALQRYALQQLILPCARSSSGKRDVSITETQQNQRTRKAK